MSFPSGSGTAPSPKRIKLEQAQAPDMSLDAPFDFGADLFGSPSASGSAPPNGSNGAHAGGAGSYWMSPPAQGAASNVDASSLLAAADSAFPGWGDFAPPPPHVAQHQQGTDWASLAAAAQQQNQQGMMHQNMQGMGGMSGMGMQGMQQGMHQGMGMGMPQQGIGMGYGAPMQPQPPQQQQQMWPMPLQPGQPMGPPAPAPQPSSSAAHLLPPAAPPGKDVPLEHIEGAPPGKQRKKAAPKARKKKDGAEGAPEAGPAVKVEQGEEEPPKKKRGRPKKNPATTPSASAAGGTSASPHPGQSVTPAPSVQPSATPAPAAPAAATPAPAASMSAAARPAGSATPAPVRLPMASATPAPSKPAAVATPSAATPSAASTSAAAAGASAAAAPLPPPHFPPAQPAQAGAAQGQAQDGVDGLQDVVGMSGVDLRAEEDAIQQRDVLGDSMQQAYMNSTGGKLGESFLTLPALAMAMRSVASQHGLGIDMEALHYLSLATQQRFRNLVAAMIAASRHRNWASHEREPPSWREDAGEGDEPAPMYHIAVDSRPAAQLAVLERVERVEEQRARKLRVEREEREANPLLAAAASAAAGGAGEGDSEMADGSGGPSTPRADLAGRKKIGATQAAKNMSEDVRRRLANNTAARQLGGASTPKWMSLATASNSALNGSPLAARSTDDGEGASSGLSSLPKPRFAPLAGASLGKALPGTPGSKWSGLGPSSFASAAGTPTGVKTSGWADLGARQRQQEEERRRQLLMVSLPDALHALEMERAAGKGRGSGEKALFRARALGYVGERKREEEGEGE